MLSLFAVCVETFKGYLADFNVFGITWMEEREIIH